MVIHYHDGRAIEAILVSRTGDSIRVAAQGADDIAEFREINGTWVSEDCEPVTVGFVTAQVAVQTVPALEDCICPPELAARLVTMLYACSEEPAAAAPPPTASSIAFSAASSGFTV